MVLAAVALEVKEAGGVPGGGGEPGLGGRPHCERCSSRVFRKVGYREVADRYGFELSLDTEWEGVPHPDGQVVKRVEVIKPVLRVDGIINLPKFKTHAFMIFTGATKNLFGVIPGLTKVGVSRQVRHSASASPACFWTWPRSCARGSASWTPSWPWRGRARAPGARPRPLGLLMAGDRHGGHRRGLLPHRRVRRRPRCRCFGRPRPGTVGGPSC